jgi:hypothetical protein
MQEAAMAAPERSTDWSAVDQVVQRRISEGVLPLHPDRPLEVPAAIEPPAESPARPDGDAVQVEGVVAQYRANKVARKAALAHLEVWYRAQLEVARHRLNEVARVRKAEATLLAEEFLHSINSRHLHFLTELGLRNEDTRNRAFLALGDQTSRALREIQERDWPASILQTTIGAVLERHQRFFEKIVRELGE